MSAPSNSIKCEYNRVYVVYVVYSIYVLLDYQHVQTRPRTNATHTFATRIGLTPYIIRIRIRGNGQKRSVECYIPQTQVQGQRHGRSALRSRDDRVWYIKHKMIQKIIVITTNAYHMFITRNHYGIQCILSDDDVRPVAFGSNDFPIRSRVRSHQARIPARYAGHGNDARRIA